MLIEIKLRRQRKGILAGSVIALSLLLCGTEIWGQDAPCLRRTVIVNVVTEAGFPVRNLVLNDFSAKLGSKPVGLLSLTRQTASPRIVLVLDASKSMSSPAANWERVRQMALDLVRKAPEASPIALVVFGSQVAVRVDFAKGRMAVREQLLTIQPGENILVKRQKTALWDAFLEAVQILQPPVPGDVIYAITDGVDNASRAQRTEIERRLIASEVRMFINIPFIVVPAIVVPADDPFLVNRSRTLEEFNAPVEISKLTEATGGAVFYVPPSPKAFTQSFDEKYLAQLSAAVVPLYEQMKNYYRLEIDLPVEVDKARAWKLELVKTPDKKRKGLRLAYPRKLLPCRESASPK